MWRWYDEAHVPLVGLACPGASAHACFLAARNFLLLFRFSFYSGNLGGI